jgi:glycosyltransferase involved in cell wall biosynthesis
LDSSRLAIFTICSNNYVPMAKVLLSSAQAHHPDASLYLCLADALLDEPDFYPEDCTIIPAETLSIPDFPCFAFRYDVMEFNTALKPFMIRKLLSFGHNLVLYFDPDIEIFRPLTSVMNALHAGAPFVLTPHVCKPSEGTAYPDDIGFMQAGIYNLGFLGVSAQDETDRLLRWWSRRLQHQCINDQARGLFVDQKFMDLIPAFAAKAVILRDATMNVAYWNLSQRHLMLGEAGTWLVDGAPLGFFHFSGFNPHDLSQLSKHTTAFAGGEIDAALKQLMARYSAQLLANGQGMIPTGIYAYGRFRSGTNIPDFVRRFFRVEHPQWVGDPFENFEEYLDFPLAESWHGPAGQFVTRLMGHLHDLHPWFKQTYDPADSVAAQRYLNWLACHGDSLVGDARLLEPALERVGNEARSSRRLPAKHNLADADVGVVSYFSVALHEGEAGRVGEVGRLTLEALSITGLTVRGVEASSGTFANRTDPGCGEFLVPVSHAPVEVLVVKSDQIALIIDHLKDRLRDDAYRILVPVWDLSNLSNTLSEAYCHVDEIWAPTRFVQRALLAKVDKPVVRMPLMLDFEPPPPTSRSRFNLPKDKFLFFFAFDYLSDVERQNPLKVVEAFRRAFRRSGEIYRVALVLKTINVDKAPSSMQLLRDMFEDDTDMILIERPLSREETLGLVGTCDAVVSLHRSEGLGLLVAEAMVLGKPVVSTDYSATTELITPRTGYPVDYRLVPVKESDCLFAEGQVWADADVEHAAWQMRQVFRGGGAVAARVAAARQHVRTSYGQPEVTGRQLDRLRMLGLAA